MRIRLGLLLVVLVALWWGCSNDKPLSPTETPATQEPLSESVGLWIGPAQGLTTTWYPAPVKFSVTNDVGKMNVKLVTTDGAIVEWTGAVEISRLSNVSIAEVTLPAAGSHLKVEVTAKTVARDGGQTVSTFATGVTVANRSAADVSVGAVTLSEAEPRLDEFTTPEARMRLLLEGRSIASVTSINGGGYRTAANSLVHAKTTVNDMGMLLEWRMDGNPCLLGIEGEVKLPARPGNHVLSVGPPAQAQTARVQTFATSVVVESGTIVANEPMTFHVKTDPPGFESEVVWMAGSLFGTAEPATGRGATFTAVFDRPWPTTPDGILCMGVRAGTAALIVEVPVTFGGEMTRLSTDIADAEKALGEHACCIQDSLLRQQTYDAINQLEKSRDAINKAISVYNGLSNLTRKAIDIAYKNVDGDLRNQLNNVEAALTKFKTLPDCSSQAQPLDGKGAHALSFCTDLVDFLVGFGTALTIMGLFLAAVGVALIWIPLVGAPIATAGVLFGSAGLLLIGIGYGVSLLC